MAEKLFVYGTLGPGRPNEQVLKSSSWKRATVRGKLRQEGWDAEIGYPGSYSTKLAKKLKVIFLYDRIYQIIEMPLMI